VGNADGEGRPGLTGIQAAAPVLFDVLDVLPQSEWFATPYDELIEAELCDRSGQLAGVFCNKAVTQIVPKRGLRTKSCLYPQQVFLDVTETNRVNSSCYPLADMKQQSWFALPPTMEYYYAAKHPEYRSLPPFASGCLKEGEQTMEFLYPKRNETILIPKNFNETSSEVIFKVAHRNPETSIFWYLDGTYIGETETFHELALTPKPGTYELIATDFDGYQLRQQVTIAITSAQ
jgi:penicillin-binding protein 1C